MYDEACRGSPQGNTRARNCNNPVLGWFLERPGTGDDGTHVAFAIPGFGEDRVKFHLRRVQMLFPPSQATELLYSVAFQSALVDYRLFEIRGACTTVVKIVTKMGHHPLPTMAPLATAAL